MQRVAWQVFFVVLLLNAATLIGQSQTADSLGEVARANHAKQQALEAAGTTPKIITNQDLSLGPVGSSGVLGADDNGLRREEIRR